MENLRGPSLIVILLAAFILLHSCSKKGDFKEDNLLTSVVDSDDEDTDNTPENDNNDDASSNDIQEITLYRVIDGDLRKIIDYPVSGQNKLYQENIRKHQEIWILVKKIIPSNHLEKLNEFLIYNDETNQSSGFISETSPDLSKWKIGIGINNADNQMRLINTIIHQFGHLLTLNNIQINSNITETSCSTYFAKKGCTNSLSYINELHATYWKDIWSDYKMAQDSGIAMQQFYNTYQSRFVTQYASINPIEDIAEVFLKFVTRDDMNFGGSIADKKIQLMYNHNELVESRNYIRGNFDMLSSRFGSTSLPSNWYHNGFGSFCLEK